MNRAERRALGAPAMPALAPRVVPRARPRLGVWLSPRVPEGTVLVAVRREPPKACR